MTRILGIDPGLRKTGWGMIEKQGGALRFLDCGIIRTDCDAPLCSRLAKIDSALTSVIRLHRPDTASIEETFMNNNPASALLLGQARGVAVVAAAREGVMVAEYSANLVKKSVVGNGHATKEQIAMMVRVLLPLAKAATADEADALAIAICHAHHSGTIARMAVI